MKPHPDASPVTLNIIGGGKLGQTFGYLWRQAGIFTVAGVVNRSLKSSQQAASFINQASTPDDTTGQTAAGLSAISDLPPVPCYQITASDDQIRPCAEALAESGLLRPGDLVFHCSGAYSAEELLAPVKEQGALIASLHPASSFADPHKAVHQFKGTYCVIEGDKNAVAFLTQATESIGGAAITLRPENKTLYHAAAVFTSNYMTTLLDAAFWCGAEAGLTPEQTEALLRPLAEATLENNFSLGTAKALTGPIARGDTTLVEKQIKALAQKAPERALFYARLGLATTDVAAKEKITDKVKDVLESLLKAQVIALTDPSDHN